jgi:hypothetical protein
MGEVYRARDPRLGRDVAIKVLPAAYSADPERLTRFEQEAQAAAALNHPKILAVYDLGQHDGAPYIVSELLEGETLRERLGAGVLPVRKAVEYAVQVCHGLAAAHERGITHRDLKPENIFLTTDGRVKILDFGLAKLTQVEPVQAGASGLPTTPPNTVAGIVLGTIGYMAPEQVRGQQADHRSDIFAFGAVLYEMLSGRRAFQGVTAADTMSAILKEEPPELPIADRQIPPTLVRIVNGCLDRNPAARFKSADDLAFALEGVTGQSGAAPALASRAAWTRRGRTAWIAAGVLILAALGVGAVAYSARSTEQAAAPEMRLQVVTPPDAHPSVFLLSPDGHSLAFLAGGRLWPVTKLENQFSHAYPWFLPDGRRFLFYARGTPDTSGLHLGSMDAAETTRLGAADTAGMYTPTDGRCSSAGAPYWHSGSTWSAAPWQETRERWPSQLGSTRTVPEVGFRCRARA